MSNILKLEAIIGRRIAGEMAMNDINQAHVAEILHISQPTLSQKISGRTRFSAQEIAILSDLFDVSADFLLGKSD